MGRREKEMADLSPTNRRKPTETGISVTIPRDVSRKIAKLATAAMRTKNAQIAFMLTEATKKIKIDIEDVEY